jgi:hypothetical protein
MGDGGAGFVEFAAVLMLISKENRVGLPAPESFAGFDLVAGANVLVSHFVPDLEGTQAKLAAITLCSRPDTGGCPINVRRCPKNALPSH